MKSILLLFLWVGYSVVGAQQTPKDTTKTNKASEDYQPNGSKLIPQITPKSPAAAALGRYGEYPVSLYTGLPTIEIPLFEFKVDKLVVPIKLMYHASGNKVNDLASWVGLGWSLHTGGMITRNVQGVADENTSQSGLLSQTVTTPVINYACQTVGSRDSLRRIIDNEVDTQRDLFSYQLPIGGNTFIVTSPPNDFSLLSPEPITLRYDANLSFFHLTDAEGTQFRFTEKEGVGIPIQSTSWMLTQIIGAQPTQAASYTYQTVSNETSPEPYDLVVVQAEVEDQNQPNVVTTGVANRVNNNDSAPTVFGKQPKVIVFPGGKLVFQLEAIGREEGGFGLDYIDVFAYNINTDSYTRIKRYDFVYRTVYRKLENGNNGKAVALLDEVRLVQDDGTTAIGSYSFTYNTSLRLPPANSRQKDFWGYYNAQQGNTLIPTQNFSYQAFNLSATQTTISVGDANRDPREDLMQAWILQSIRFPTGGSTVFTYETNRYSGPGSSTLLAGGLRISTIKSYSAAGQFTSAKRYAYGTNESGVGTPRFFASGNEVKPRTIIQNFYINFDQPFATATPYDYKYRVYTLSSGPTGPLTPNEGSPVTYPEVTEYLEDESGTTIGRTVHQFNDDEPDAVQFITPGRYFVTSRAWKRGQLRTRLIYDHSNRLKSRLVNSYDAVPSGSSNQPIGYFLARDILQQSYGDQNAPCTSPLDTYRGPITYPFSFGTLRLSRSDEYVYDDQIANRYTLKINHMAYSSVHYQLREERTIVQAGEVIGTQYTYPQDFTATISSSSDERLKAIKVLQERNNHQPIETITFRQRPNDVRRYKTGSLTTFTAISANHISEKSPNRLALPYQLYRAETDKDQTTYTSTADQFNQFGLFNIDPLWGQPRLTMTAYNDYGDLSSYSVTAGGTGYYYWSHQLQDVDTFLTYLEYTYTNPHEPSTIEINSFTYDLPLLGSSSVTDKRGVATFYEYDSFGRLARIKDHGGQLLKQFIYRFATSTQAQP